MGGEEATRASSLPGPFMLEEYISVGMEGDGFEGLQSGRTVFWGERAASIGEEVARASSQPARFMLEVMVSPTREDRVLRRASSEHPLMASVDYLCVEHGKKTDGAAVMSSAFPSFGIKYRPAHTVSTGYGQRFCHEQRMSHFYLSRGRRFEVCIFSRLRGTYITHHAYVCVVRRSREPSTWSVRAYIFFLLKTAGVRPL